MVWAAAPVALADPPPEWTVQRLPTVGEQPGWTGLGFNNRGQVAGWVFDEARNTLPVWFDGTTTRLLASPPGAQGGRAVDLNDAGQILADHRFAGGTGLTIYQGGEARALDAPPGWNVSALAMNRQGAVIANGYSLDGRRQAMVYEGGRARLLGTDSEAVAINDRGQVLYADETGASYLDTHGATTRLGGARQGVRGESLNDHGLVGGIYDAGASGMPVQGQAVLLDGAEMTELGGSRRGHVRFVNNRGQAAADMYVSFGSHAHLYDNGSFTNLTPGLGERDSSWIVDLNNRGQVLYLVELFDDPQSRRIQLWDNGVVTDITALINRHLGEGAADPYFTSFNQRLNDAGQILLNTLYGGAGAPLLLTPVPEPATWALLLAGLCLLAWRWLRPRKPGVLLLALAAGGGAAAEDWRVEWLPAFGGGDLELNALNDRGQLIGLDRSGPYGSSSRTFLYGNGTLTDLSAVLGVPSNATAINNQGQIAGSIGDDVFLYSGGTLTRYDVPGVRAGTRHLNERGQILAWSIEPNAHSFLITDGQITPVGPVTGMLRASGYALNDRGDVAGELAQAGDPTRQAFFQRDGQMTLLMPQSPTSHVADMDRHGRVLFFYERPDGQLQNTIWHDGVVSNLSTPGGSSSWLNQMNDAGEILGSGTMPDGRWTHFLMSHGATINLNALAGGDVHATHLTEQGIVAGTFVPDGTTDRHVFVYVDGQVIDLTRWMLASFDDVASIETRGLHMALNDVGQLAGTAVMEDGSTRMFIVSSIPEPPAVLMLVSGTLVVWALRRRRSPRQDASGG
jgi:uncharacterized membrane protein